MRILILVSLLLLPSGVGQAEDWTPPDNPDPSVILNEAKADANSGKHEVALAKLIWYHENATKLQPSQSGVRRSFALAQWLELGEVYPPALEKLVEIRDKTEEKIRDEKQIRVRFEDFHDFTALNDTLRQEERTVEAFKWVSEKNEDDAQRVYGISEAALIRHKEYELCGRFIDPEADVERIGESYTSGLTLSKRFGKSHQDYVDRKVVNEAAILVAILVKNDRIPEAKAAADELKTYVTDGKLLKKLERELDAALKGIVPKPWP